MRKPWSLVVVCLVLFSFITLFGSPVLAGSEDPDVAVEETVSAITTGNPKVTVEELKYRLRPLTQDELIVEADAWLEVLKAHLLQISELQIQAMQASADEKAALLKQINKLQEERTVLIDRVKTVINEFQTKGGDVESYEKYVRAVSGIDVDVTDVGGTWSVISGWLLSPEGGLRWAKNLILCVLALVVFMLIANVVRKAVQHALERVTGMTDLLKSFIVNVAHKTTFFIGVIIALSMLEVNIGPFLAAIGAAGFIIGFALQGTLSNFAAGILILLYRPYDVGDVVNVAGITGSVNDMSLVSTTLRLPDNQTVVIPNNQIWGGVITNVTGSATRRINMVFGIGYNDEIEKAQQVLEDILAQHPLILKDPEPVVRVHELADSSVNFVVRPWVKTGDYFTVYWDVTRTVKERFDAEQISIPYPQQDIHVHQGA